LITGAIDRERTLPVDSSVLSWLYEEAKKRGLPLLLEADGARQRPLKAPAAHEPPIPKFAETVVVVAGLSGLGQLLTDEIVFRPERFAELSDAPGQSVVTPDILTRVLLHPGGGLKNAPPCAHRVCLLNQADTPELQASAQRMSQSLLDGYDAVIVASLKNGLVHAVREQVAGIVLAAGESKRFGKLKQLLNWHGEPFIRTVAQTALQAGLSPVVIVTGAQAADVENAVIGLDVQLVRNADWQSGQASSIVSGVKVLPQQTGGCLFLLADQPHVGAGVMRALVETHAQSLPPILAPLVREDRRANPVLFDRVTFPELLTLKGDIGGRAIFDRHKVAYLPWHDESLLLDVDTPEDYERLKSL
jgi:molybdenum cofactor cytidylyltransferase